eukprot:3066366-Lingulodinium_polyedra.AAC.1
MRPRVRCEVSALRARVSRGCHARATSWCVGAARRPSRTQAAHTKQQPSSARVSSNQAARKQRPGSTRA